MKITIYTITGCQFSKQEKEYLSSHGLQFEEKNLETNREFLTEMLAVGGNFAGTPVTKIEKDDGQIVVLKGFTATEFDKVLAVAPTATAPVEPKAAEQPEPVQQTAPAEEPAPLPVTPEPSTPVTPSQPEVTSTSVADPAMASILNNLEQQVQVATPPAPAAPVEQVPVVPVVPIPVAPIPEAPVIPDPKF